MEEISYGESNVTEEHFTDVSEFLETLRRNNPRWSSSGHALQSQWIYRGHREAGWALLPSAWRQGKLDPFIEIKNRYRADAERLHGQIAAANPEPPFRDNDNYHTGKWNPRWIDHALQVLAETNAIYQFAILADKIDHRVPDIDALSSTINDPLTFLEDIIYKSKAPPLDPTRVHALAQHHGVATQLLDWTEDGRIAAFFAAEEVKPDQESDIAVWCLRRDTLDDATTYIFEPFRAGMGNLLYQKGLFTYQWYAHTYFFKHGRWPTIAETRQRSNMNKLYTFEPETIQKLTLPAARCKELLDLLWKEDISRAHLMPSYDNVVKTLKANANRR